MNKELDLIIFTYAINTLRVEFGDVMTTRDLKELTERHIANPTNWYYKEAWGQVLLIIGQHGSIRLPNDITSETVAEFWQRTHEAAEYFMPNNGNGNAPCGALGAVAP